jgi:TIR domain
MRSRVFTQPGPKADMALCEQAHSDLTGIMPLDWVGTAKARRAFAMPRNIFISYRRDDNKYQALRIFDAFQKTDVRAFYDTDSIPLGRDFRKVIMAQVQECDVLLALVGRNWAECLDPKTGLRRLENPDDFVRIEIGTALNRGIPVVPVILDDAPIPGTHQLPKELSNLFDMQAEFISFRTFDDDVKRLITKLKIKSTQKLEPSKPTSALQTGDPPLGVASVLADIPQPSLATPTKISWWVQRQAAIWFSVLKNPREFVAGTDIDSQQALGNSIQFLFFIVVCSIVIKWPRDLFIGHLSIFNPTYYFMQTVLLFLQMLIFSFAVHFSAKAMGGRGSVSRTMTSMFYAAGLFPIFVLLGYVELLDPATKEHWLRGKTDWERELPFSAVVALIAVIFPIPAYIAIKLVSVIKFVFSFGTIRAAIALAVAVRREARLVDISTFIMAAVRIRALTTAPRIKPTSIFLRSA